MLLKSLLTKALATVILVLIPARVAATTGVLPVDGDTLNYTHVLFQWEQLPGAANYELQVARNDTIGGADPFGTAMAVQLFDSTLLAIVTSGLTWDQPYVWRLRSIDAAGTAAGWSNPAYFNTAVLPDTVPTFHIDIFDTSAYQPGLTYFDLDRTGVVVAVDMLGEPVLFLAQDINVAPRSRFSEMLPDGNILMTAYVPPDGSAYIVTLDNDLVWEPPMGQESGIHHSVIRMPNGNIMAVTTTEQLKPIPPGPWEDTDFVAGDSVIWWGDDMVEWDMAGNEVWRWSVFDYFDLADIDTAIFANAPLRGYHDWTHANAVFYDAVDNAVYFSFRSLDRITKIDYATKEVIWNMGLDMVSGEVQVGTDLNFRHQHAIESLANRNLMLYDNHNDLTPQLSRGIEIALTETDTVPVAEIVWQYVLPESLYTASRGDCDRLPNGNTLITAANPRAITVNGHILEVTMDSSLVWQLRLGNDGGTSLFSSERLPGLYPQAFSMIQPALATGIVTPTIFVPSGAASLEFKLFNEGYMAQTYIYEVIDSYGWFEDVGEIELAPGESGMFTISGTVVFDIYPNLVQVTVTPLNASALEAVHLYEVYSQILTGVKSNGLPTTYAFDAAYPNPFNPVTHLQYALPTAGRVSLVIYDISGREVARLIDGYQPAGLYKSVWHAGSFASGIYFAQLRAEGFIKTQKIILMK